MFPFYKKATAIGICNLVARTITVASSLAAEVDRPWPVVMLLIANGLAFIAAFFLPGIAEEEAIEKAEVSDIVVETTDDVVRRKGRIEVQVAQQV